MGSTEFTNRPLAKLAGQLRSGELQIPEIQRDFVWKPADICTFLDSLYRGYPFSSLLFWDTEDSVPSKESDGERIESTQNTPHYVLDGQQRLTAIYNVLYETDIDIRFHLLTEEFALHRSAMDEDSLWVSVRELWNTDTWAFVKSHGLAKHPDEETIGPRISTVHNLPKRLAAIEIVSGFDYDEVTDIFIRINSEGRRLAGVDLAMAILALRLPNEFQSALVQFEHTLALRGWYLDKGTLIRCLIAVSTGEARFARLCNRLSTPSSIDDLRTAWGRTKDAIETFLTELKGKLGIESWQWIASKNALVVPVAHIATTPKAARDIKGALRWFLLSLAWQRYGAGAEGRLKQDLDDLATPTPFKSMETRLAQQIGRGLEITPDDLAAGGTANRRRFVLHAYIAARKGGASDWSEGTVLSTSNLGRQRALEQHHIFPQAVIRELYDDENVDEIANIAFLSKAANLEISKDSPMEYLTDVDPIYLDQQFVPLDKALWTVDAFPAFLDERRRLLADGINAVLDDLQ